MLEALFVTEDVIEEPRVDYASISKYDRYCLIRVGRQDISRYACDPSHYSRDGEEDIVFLKLESRQQFISLIIYKCEFCFIEVTVICDRLHLDKYYTGINEAASDRRRRCPLVTFLETSPMVELVHSSAITKLLQVGGDRYIKLSPLNPSAPAATC
jgi:hypothetical protein